MTIFLTSYGYITDTGFGGHDRQVLWDPAQGELSHLLRWRLVSTSPHDRFGRMDLLSKYVTVAVEMLGLSPPPPESPRYETGMTLGTAFGCHGVDLEFYRGITAGEGPSPTLFAYTLPTIALGEVSIRYGLGGPSYCFLAGLDSGLVALLEAVQLLKSEECSNCLCVIADAFPQEAEPLARKLAISEDLSCYAYAFLFERRHIAPAKTHKPLARVSLTTAGAMDLQRKPRSSREEAARLLEFLGATGPDCPSQIKLPPLPAYGLTEVVTVTRENLIA